MGSVALTENSHDNIWYHVNQNMDPFLYFSVMKMGKSKSMSVVYKTKTGMKDKTPVKCDDDDDDDDDVML